MATNGGHNPGLDRQGSWSEEMDKEHPLVDGVAGAGSGVQGDRNGIRKSMSWAERLGSSSGGGRSC